jgi:hypothetical protein
MIYKIILTGFAVLIIGAGCSDVSSKKDWTAFYYPDRDNIGDESTWIIQPGLESLEECRDWVDSIASTNTHYDYECGVGCRYEPNYLTTVCKETLQ